MTHLDPGQLYAAVFDATSLGSEDEQHLASCGHCRKELANLKVLAYEFALARSSEPSESTMERYYALFSHVQQQPARSANFWRTIKAMLTWDSRQQALLQGVRSSGAGAAYRLLYATHQAEVELLVEPDAHGFRTQGEIIARHERAPSGIPSLPALIQWFDARGAVRYETESDASGLFSLRNIVPGTYRLAIVSAASDVIEIEALEIM
jgi:anti-sigma factor RsiW